MVVLNGAWQSGKSTLVQSLAASLLPPRQYLTLDEAPELFLAINSAVDRSRQPRRFLLTVSADVLLLPGIANSLAGRVEILSLWPLSCAEQADSAAFNRADWLSQCDLIARLLAGGFPDAVTRSNPSRRASWFDSHVQTILQRDVRDLAHIEQFTEIPNLLQLLATRSATLLNFAELSRSCALSKSTLKRYFALLEMLFLVVRLPSRERNASKRVVNAPKVFLPDSGLLCHFMGETPDSLTAKAGLPGRVVETFVLAELLKHVAFSAQRLSLWHYRTHTNIEVKASARVDGKTSRACATSRKPNPSLSCGVSFCMRGPRWCPLAKNCGPCRF